MNLKAHKSSKLWWGEPNDLTWTWQYGNYSNVNQLRLEHFKLISVFLFFSVSVSLPSSSLFSVEGVACLVSDLVLRFSDLGSRCTDSLEDGFSGIAVAPGLVLVFSEVFPWRRLVSPSVVVVLRLQAPSRLRSSSGSSGGGRICVWCWGSGFLLVSSASLRNLCCVL